jgi:hypothetical protein
MQKAHGTLLQRVGWTELGRRDVPMEEAGESATMRWRETDDKRVLSGADNGVRKAASTFIRETE